MYSPGFDSSRLVPAIAAAFSVMLCSIHGQVLVSKPWSTNPFTMDSWVDYGHHIRLADLNGDAIQDVAILDYTEDTLSIFIGTASLHFEPEFSTSVPDSRGFAIADWNSDGEEDIAVVSVDGDVLLLLGDGAGGLEATYPAVSFTETVAGVVAADMDLDGNPDLVTTGSSGIMVGLGDGLGDFTLLVVAGGAFRRSAVGDLNNDGIPDIVASRSGNQQTFAISYLGDGLGTFSSAGTVSNGVIGGSDAVVLVDFNQDGDLDLAIDDLQVKVWMGNGQGGFGPVQNVSGFGPFAAGDLDGDSLPDLFGSSGSGGPRALINDGLGGFSIGSVSCPCSSLEGVVLRDLDQDGDLDAVTAPLFVYVNETSSAPFFVRGDGNGFPGVDLSDALTILNYVFNSSPVPCVDACDVDDTGTVNLIDVMLLLIGLFEGGGFPPAPFPICGFDPTPDQLGCESFPACP